MELHQPQRGGESLGTRRQNTFKWTCQWSELFLILQLDTLCAAASEDRSLPPTLPAPPINNAQQVSHAAQTGEHGGRQVHLVQAGVRVLVQVAVGVALRLVDHDADGGQVEQCGGHVVRHVGARPARAPQQRDQVLFVQEGEKKQREGEEPEEHRHEQHEVNGALVFVGSDGDPQPGSEHDLQDPDDPQEAPEEL